MKQAQGRFVAVCHGMIFYILFFFSVFARAQSTDAHVCPNAEFNRQSWMEDFSQLTAGMSSHYANLEFAIHDRHMDLPQLRKDTEGKLQASCDEHDARSAIESFLKAFGDGHLVVDWPKASSSPAATTGTESTDLCSRLGYKKQQFKPGIEFSQLPQFASLGGDEDEWFPGGILRLGNTRVGVIRMAIFSEHSFPEVCERVVAEKHLAASDKCDDKCDDGIAVETGNRLTAALVRRSEQLQAAGAAAILVDITNNGGGSDWVESVMRSLSRVPLHESRLAFIKHEHWTKELQDELEQVKADEKQGAGSKDILQEAAARLQLGIARSKEPCDRNNIWIDGRISCSLLVPDLLFASGLLPYAEAGSFASLESRSDLFHPLQYVYTESSDRLPLYVVQNAHTWSAAELFSAVLQDNGGAVILGEVTGGAGCGYTNDGIPTTLKNSHADVKMPDCVRLRKDGSNENRGVTPDVWVPWAAQDNAYIHAAKLFGALQTVIRTGSKEGMNETHP